MTASHRYRAEDLRKYFDDNTRSFIRFGEGAQAIHRAVWAPGVTSKAEAFRLVDRDVLAQLEGKRLLDLGCGAGASLSWMAKESGADGIGVTISPVQARLANMNLRAMGLEARVRCVEASFTDLPADLGTFDLAYAIEAFVLSPDPLAFLREAAAHLRPGGRLAIVDDFLTPAGESTRVERERRWLDEFRYGWIASSLITLRELARLAESVGLRLRENRDYTPYLELRRPRDLAISALVTLGRRLPIPGQLWRSWIGGNGLQMALVHGLIDYRMVVLERA